MCRVEVESAHEVALPRAAEVAGERKNQIEGDVADSTAAKGPNRLADLWDIMSTMHPFQRRLIEALRAKRDAIESGGNPMRDSHVVDVVRIRLDGDLSGARNRRAA